MTTFGPTTSPSAATRSAHRTPLADQTAGHANTPTAFSEQLQAITATGKADMLTAGRLEDELNRAQALAKLLEAGPKAAKDLLA
ncbi:hypothetical protein C0Q88_11990 [Ralstonia pickettii]|uniref:Uncharacterized protein n=1 Tax=Ralstonia pickettii TaxID=329 RepID=A0A2N4TSH0_RALPI|nr:hypothetical protein [Ralstonia pickettii]PLC42660.1 hypothetical protein C0Q88_11990 [Ralstonia pickettii]